MSCESYLNGDGRLAGPGGHGPALNQWVPGPATKLNSTNRDARDDNEDICGELPQSLTSNIQGI